MSIYILMSVSLMAHIPLQLMARIFSGYSYKELQFFLLVGAFLLVSAASWGLVLLLTGFITSLKNDILVHLK